MSQFPSVTKRVTELRERLARGEYPLATATQLDAAERVAADYAVVCGEAYIAAPDAVDGHVNIGAVAGGGTAHVTLVYPDGTSRVPDGWGDLDESAINAARRHGAFYADSFKFYYEELQAHMVSFAREPVNVRVTFSDDTQRTVTAFHERGGWHACPPCGSMQPVYATPRDAAIAHVRMDTGPFPIFAEAEK